MMMYNDQGEHIAALEVRDVKPQTEWQLMSE